MVNLFFDKAKGNDKLCNKKQEEERKKERKNERKKERKKDIKKERRKEGKKERKKQIKKEGKKERTKERKKEETRKNRWWTVPPVLRLAAAPAPNRCALEGISWRFWMWFQT